MKFKGKKLYFGVLILILILNIIAYSTNSNQDVKTNLYKLENTESSTILSMIIECNGKSTQIRDTMEIQKFIQIVKTCSEPIQLRKMRVVDRFKIELIFNQRRSRYRFYKKNQRPFMMINSIGGEAYECRNMEAFLSKYK